MKNLDLIFWVGIVDARFISGWKWIFSFTVGSVCNFTEVHIVSRFGEDIFNLDINRPFVFLIADEEKDAIIFTGKVLNPAATKDVVNESKSNVFWCIWESTTYERGPRLLWCGEQTTRHFELSVWCSALYKKKGLKL